MKRLIAFWLIGLALGCLPVAAIGAPLSAGDQVRVEVVGEPDLSVTRIITEDGTVDLPLLGPVAIAGLEPLDAGERVRGLYDDGYLRQPRVALRCVQRGVGGEVGPTSRTGNRPRSQPGDAEAVVGAPLSGSAGYSGSGGANGAGPARISGWVVDSATRRPLGRVLLSAEGQTAYSNERGEFVLEVNPAIGQLVLKAVMAGYQPVARRISLAAGHVAGLELAMGRDGGDRSRAGGSAAGMAVGADTTMTVSGPSSMIMPIVPSTGRRMVEIVDGRTGRPVSGAAMLMTGRVFQANRLGQVELTPPFGDILVMADGYRITQGPADRVLRPGDLDRIVLEPVMLADEVVVWIRDRVTRKPLPGAVVKMGPSRVTIGKSGRLNIREINTEYGELVVEKKGYRTVRQIIDFKEAGEREVLMSPGR